jgi:hypothetical protein
MNMDPIAENENNLQQNSQENYWNQFSNVVAMAAKEDQIIWTIFGVFWAANAVLIVALFTTGNLPESLVGILVSIIGLILSIIWALIQHRAINWLRYYEHIIFRIERKYLHLPMDINLSPRINKFAKKKIIKGKVRVRVLMNYSGPVAVILWLLALIYFSLGIGLINNGLLKSLFINVSILLKY